MTSREDPSFETLDTYIRVQLSNAADTYASRTDIHVRLENLIREAENNKEYDDGAAAADGGD
jgi:hypothetical protein